ELPALEIVPQQRHFLFVGDLHRPEALNLRAQHELALMRDADVPHPLRVASRRDEILRSLVRQEVTGEVRHSPDLRPRTRRTRDPQMLIPSRVQAPTKLLKTCL